MDRPAAEGDAGRRIGLFCAGLAAAAFSAFAGRVAFALSAADFSAEWWQGWGDACTRLAGSPGLAVAVGLAAAITGLGIGVMGLAVTGWQFERRPRRGT